MHRANLAVWGDIKGVHRIFHAAFAFNIAIDVLITIANTYYLLRPRSEYRDLTSILDVILLWVIGTGALTSVFAFITLVTCIVSPDRLTYMALEIFVAKLYMNSLLAMLNTREKLRAKAPMTLNVNTSVTGSTDQSDTSQLSGSTVADKESAPVESAAPAHDLERDAEQRSNISTKSPHSDVSGESRDTRIQGQRTSKVRPLPVIPPPPSYCSAV
ncbi:hypothetical protein PUNSTDRAFT_40862 [Punctularia strigosozonata HHB-11173 SS5]|uniref:uncharacterized protein n=1 Tax=Punctularia strigosozonata (strain HHB-11173) TaxID=741275 RepID=UPI00044181AD|nr:uncharacterized protein PUNSTDRAFT_40862 [Punctularia strigosozonata HHB-11173 SS5]EIN13178.1 hypothetical protein PUNSTDRAFT_40862 [Punctularia strigosozonata HHB-11173 SS5]